MTRQPHTPAPNVYLAAYRDFRAIPGAPWVYWIPEGIRRLFRELPKLGEVAQPRQGLATADNFRFLRYWWEVGLARIAFDCHDRDEAQTTGKRWFPYMKGGAYRKWYGNQEYVVNWWQDGAEIQNFYGPNGRLASRPQNTDYYFREGVTWTLISAKGFSARYMPRGFIIGHKGPASFFTSFERYALGLALLNSKAAIALLEAISPGIGFEIGHLALLPVPPMSRMRNLLQPVHRAIYMAACWESFHEPTFDFIAPPRWDTGIEDMAAAQARLRELEAQINEEVYHLYGISDEDRAAIEAELGDKDAAKDEEDAITREELAARWVSYAVGIVMGRFRPGLPRDRRPHRRGPLGRAVFHPDDFAVGSLPAPTPEDFDTLVGHSPHPQPLSQGARGERFAYVDEQGGRHLFPRQVEEALRDLALPEGIAVLQAHHPLDLTTRVRQALELMWGEANAQAMVDALGGDLTRYLERDFWKKMHLKMYRNRPVYWMLQSPKQAITVYLHHEQGTRDTLFVVKTEIVEPTKRLLATRFGEATDQAEASSGRARMRARKAAEQALSDLQDIAGFSEALDRVLERGYEPNLDDGVLINLAPLHELVPWPRKKRYGGRAVSELEATWKALEAGEYDWAHMAMRYWPDRVRDKARRDRSLSIAHGL